MSITFNSDEIFEIAVQIEKNGAMFYRMAADMFSDEAINSLLLELAAMEDQHEKTFDALRDELSAGDPVALVFDPDDQAALYLQAVADGNVFDLKGGPSAMLPDGITIEELLNTAIGVEKESVVFYTGMKEIVAKKLGKDKIDIIIKEEIGHITNLRGKLKELRN